MKKPGINLSHPEEFLDVIGAVGRDARYRSIKETIRNRMRKGENVSMCIIAEELENTGIQKGMEKGNMLCLIRQTLKKQKKGLSVSDIDSRHDGRRGSEDPTDTFCCGRGRNRE